MRTSSVMRSLLLAAVACGASLVAAEASAAAPAHASHLLLPSSNGRGALVYDASKLRISSFLEHPYRYPSEGRETRNFAFDAYPGVRSGNDRAWLTTVAASKIEYVPGTGIVHVVRTFAGLEIDEFSQGRIDASVAELAEDVLDVGFGCVIKQDSWPRW